MLNRHQRFLITGGDGFIGSTLTDLLKRQNKEVYSFDIVNDYDVRKYRDLQDVVDVFEPDIIISMASVAGIDRVANDPIGTIETNILGVRNLLKIKGDVKLVHLSTSEVYGESADRNKETDPTIVGAIGSPRWSYQASKVCADHLITNSDSEALIIRPFNVFGPKQVGHGAIADFIDWAKKGKDLKIYGDGLQTRSWCSVDDFLVGVISLIEMECKGVYNVGDSRTPITIKELAEQIIKVCQSKSKLYYVPKREVDVCYRVPNIDKIMKDIGWKPTTNFHLELKRTIK
ncbi:hypothetical protein LCGC14_1872200 [marine sediment metagenome]|uniref:NAD-dependent epimerase/dehydratase domain-containing protein n=1 Tax=marine sediment metagenome TaxID=412755 RepID=A0A0F9GSS0_9ZZZZ